MRVIVAEDDFRVADIHEKFLLKVKGIEIVAKTSTCEETLKYANSLKPDLIILDNYMPDGLGIELIDRLHEIDINIDVILVSAEDEVSYFEKAIRRGVQGIIIKPASLGHFVQTIENYIRVKNSIKKRDKVDQNFIDEYFGIKNPNKQTELVKGIDPLTLEKVEKILTQQNKGYTAELMGKEMKASRTTARRYLEYLVSIGKCYAELDYGIVGRPERHYYMTSSS